jgi:hypothetical protein
MEDHRPLLNFDRDLGLNVAIKHQVKDHQHKETLVTPKRAADGA